MKFNIFKRNKEENSVAPELQQYYEAEKKERSGLSWLLAVISVAFVSLVLIGLFFGGKWLYNRVTSDDSAPVETGEVQEQTPEATTEPAQSTPVESQPAATTPAAETPAITTPSTSPATTPAPTPTTNATTPAQVPVTGDSSLPSTGPKENMLTIFVATTLVFSLAHNLYNRQLKNRS